MHKWRSPGSVGLERGFRVRLKDKTLADFSEGVLYLYASEVPRVGGASEPETPHR